MGAYPQIADWNEDGKKDLLVGDTDGKITLFTNTGTNSNPVLTKTGYIKAGGTDLDVGDRAAPVVVDWNNDGKKDLVVGNNNGNILLYLNTGTNASPTFSSYTKIKAGSTDIYHYRSSPEVFDLDGDSKKDLLVGDWDGYIYFYSNTGADASPSFTSGERLKASGTDLWVNQSARFDLADWDEDGHNDLIVGEWDAYVNLFLNQAGPVGPTWITVTCPNGGEVWYVGYNYTITWTTDNYVGLVEILLSKDSGSNWINLTEPYYAPNTGSYNYIPTPGHVSNNCLIQITSIDNATVKDRSDRVFSIVDTYVPKQYVAMRIPTGTPVPTIDGVLNESFWSLADEDSLLFGGIPESWNIKWTYWNDNLVTWKAVWSEVTNKLYVAIAISDDIRGIFDHSNPNDISFVPYLDECLEIFTDGDHSGGFYEGTYDNAQQWMVTGDNKIALDDYPSSTKYSLYTGDGLITAVSSGAKGNWTCEAEFKIYDSFPTIRKNLKIGDIIGWNIWYDDSDNETFENGFYGRDHQVGWLYTGKANNDANYFGDLKLIGDLPHIKVNSPNGGESWMVGTRQTILWASSGTSGNVKIEYSINGGSSWLPIVNSTADIGSYSWTIPYTPSTNCLVRLADVDGRPADQSDAPFKIILPPTQHFTPIWTGNPFQSMTIYCTQALLHGQTLGAGDEIGVFDGIKCVGAKVLSQPPSSADPVEIICSKDDGSGNGFSEGHSIIFNVWDQSALLESGAKAQYLDPQTGTSISPVPFTGLGTAVVQLTAPGLVTQSLLLNRGWNIVSLAVTPEGSHNLLTILSPILNHVVKVIDEQGRSIQKLLGSWYNSIGEWKVTEGYYINVDQTVTWQITGTEITTPLAIPLNAGWNIISYPCLTKAQNALAVVQPLINAGYLVKVLDEKGRSIVKIFGVWTNSIGDMQPGEGYYVNVTSNCTLTISCNIAAVYGGASTPIEAVAPQHFRLASVGNPYEPMNIFVIDAAVDGERLQAGDEIAVYDGDQCVGASVLSGLIGASNPLEIIAGKDDGSGSGFKNGNDLSFKAWRNNTGEELIINTGNVQFLDPDKAKLTYAAKFEGFGTAVIAINLVTIAVVGEVEMPVTYQLYQNYPNPFNPSTTISYDLPEATDVRIEIYDLQGNMVRRLLDGHQDAGQHGIGWDGRNTQGSRVGSGIYFYKLSCDKFNAAKKMILTK